MLCHENRDNSMPAFSYVSSKDKLEKVEEYGGICSCFLSKSQRSLKNVLYRLKELWTSTINLQIDNHRNSQACCYHISAYKTESHQEISSAGVWTAEWHWKAETHILPLGAQTLVLIGMVISVTLKGACWLPKPGWEWELACVSFLLKALNINFVQLASHPQLPLQKF